jgi:membrane-associated phospholipid phosphatase
MAKDDVSRRFTVHKWAWGVGAAALQTAIYFFIGNAHFDRSTELLRTRLDDAIPFLPATAWFYLPIYAGIFLIALACFRTRIHFDRALAGVGIIMLAGLAGHRLVAAAYPRPLLHQPYASVSHTFMAWVQAIDPPGNVFPSLHVAHTSSLALFLHHENRRLGRVVIVLAALLAVSTLTTKQHFVADLLAGFALAAFTRILLLRGVPAGDASLRPMTATDADRHAAA